MFWKSVFLLLPIFQTIISSENCNLQNYTTTLGPPRLETDFANSISNKLESILQNQLKQSEVVSQMTNRIEELKREVSAMQTQLQSLEQKQEEFWKQHRNESETATNKRKNCKGVQKSGIYTIWPSSAPQGFDVFCDMETRGGGWIYVINRFDGSLNFNLSWADYKNGFGDLNGEHWLGLENLYLLTKNHPYELLIELVDQNSTKFYAHYEQFSIGGEDEGYAIKILKGYSGDVGNDFRYHLSRKFITKDHAENLDNGHCARTFAYHSLYNHTLVCEDSFVQLVYLIEDVLEGCIISGSCFSLNHNFLRSTVSTTEGPPKPELDLVNSLDDKLESILQNQLKQNEIVSQMTNQIEELKREILVLKDYCQLTTRENFHIQTQLQKQEKQLKILNEHKNSSECQFQRRNELLHNHSDHTVSNKTEKLPENCKDVQKSGKTLSGVYTIWPSDAPKSFEVWCDMKTRGGGWIYVINRFDGSVDFNLNWTDYKNGFGDLNGEHWLGLEYLYLLTRGGFWYGYCYHCLFTTNLGSIRCVSLPTPVKGVRMMIRS